MFGGYSTLPVGLTAAPVSVADAEAQLGGLFEVSFLPTIAWSPAYLARVAADPTGDLDPTMAELAGSSQQNCILYVQMVNSRRRSGMMNRTSFMATLDELGYRGSYDVYDVQGFGNTNNHLGGRALLPQTKGYALIVQDSGRRRSAQIPDGMDLDSEKVDQATWYDDWLAGAATNDLDVGSLWLVGENICQYNAGKPLLAVTMGVGAVPDQGIAANPTVRGVAPFVSASGVVAGFVGDAFPLKGGCPVRRDYDGLSATAPAVVTHQYYAGATAGSGAVVMKSSAALEWNTIASSFAWSDIADDGMSIPTAQVELAGKILGAVLPPACLQGVDPTDVGTDPTASAPRVTRLHQNKPNPFNPVTTIDFDLAEDAEVRLDIHDVAGRLVRTLLREGRSHGRHSVTWNGLDQGGHRVSSGIYVYTLRAGAVTESRRMVLLK